MDNEDAAVRRGAIETRRDLQRTLRRSAHRGEGTPFVLMWR
jgi:hypothetical protein